MMWTKGIAIGATNNLNSVFMVSSGDVWAVGGGPRPTASCNTSPIVLCPVILHFNGGSWNTITPPPGSYTLKSIFMINSAEGWAVGEQTSTQPPSSTCTNGNCPTDVILHYTVSGEVGTWGIFPSPSTPRPLPGLNSVFMLTQNEGWSVGDNATILHYTVSGGVGTWNVATVSGMPTLSQNANLTSIFMLSPTNGWVVGGIQASGSLSAGPVILHWDGAKWTLVAPPTIPGGTSPTGHTSATLKTIYCTEPNNCWAAGYPGKIFATLIHWNGVTWNHVSTTPALLGQVPPIITSIYLFDRQGGWMVGSDPEFKTAIGGPTTALSTILRCTLGLGRIVTRTLRLTSTVNATISSMTAPLTSTTIMSHSATPAGSTSRTNGLIIIAIALILAISLLLLATLLLTRRRYPPQPARYPIRR
jgi:hypothetical protein